MNNLKRVYLNVSLAVQQTILLNDDAFHYIVRVLRCRTGEQLCVFNGDGLDYQVTLQITGKKTASVYIETAMKNDNESNVHTTLIQGLAKGERMDTVMQKAVELGVNTVIPVRTAFCSVKVDEQRQPKKHRHWQSIITSACEQCGRAVIPKLQPLQPLDEALKNVSAEHKWVLHPYPTVLATVTKESAAPPPKLSNSVAVLIGPEGGFAVEEIQAILAHHYKPKTLGKRILRTETAAIAALALVQQQWGDWHV